MTRIASNLGSIGKSPMLLGYSDTFNTGQFTLDLEYDKKKVMEYNFFVTPQTVQITQPARLGMYQSLGGRAHIDHMGQGLGTISISGMTGINPLLGPIGWIQFSLLRQIIEQYYDYCKSGKTHLTKLTLTIDFPDSPNFGKWDITIKELQLQRSSANPLMHSYNLSAILVGEDQYKDLRVGRIKTWKDSDVKESRITMKYAPSRKSDEKSRAQTGLDGKIYSIPPSEADVGQAAIRELKSLSIYPQKLLSRRITKYFPTFDDLLIDIYGKKDITQDIIQYIMKASMITNKDRLQIGALLYFPIF
jgi:hypothetical protein